MVCAHRDDKESSDCKRRNVTYLTWCLLCKKNNRESVYVGEMARTTFERGLENERDRVTEKEASHMHQHIQDEHAEDPGQVAFAMNVIRSHKSAINRQINEAVLIANYGEKNLLNSKFEYNRCILPSITILAANEKKKEKESSDYESLENDVPTKRVNTSRFPFKNLGKPADVILEHSLMLKVTGLFNLS